MLIFEQSVGSLSLLIALGFLLPDIQETHLGIFDVVNVFGVNGTHHGSLHQMFRLAIHVGAGVQKESDAV